MQTINQWDQKEKAPWHEESQENIQQETETNRKPYQLRKLCADDIFPMARIIGKIGIDELVGCVADGDITDIIIKLKNRKILIKEAEDAALSDEVSDQQTDKELQTEELIAGAAIITKVVNKLLLRLDSCRTDIYLLLSNLSGIQIEDMKKLEIEIFLEMIADVIRKEEFKNFYRVALKFIR